ncbi:uncharacterized protein TRIADDRAFT_54920 [Trichoplax adhaerens]|uniref:Uncharacterized protein n=1 Tax=Trichoplax adhaerens TaxID=10228 RepID=B3RTD1_TRIAD|nr:hypothetical protein TRIADDRAFT_54920 [Trichoplax adhaerens]EDV26674.1 hypothetical protein TRIADDRAFT_54920 [Trichoplax adhaerens]|eukprot:XP_002110670.1 hypothetical protein TRIADDRAFT_54920 [Trichoplax adhaerens]
MVTFSTFKLATVLIRNTQRAVRLDVKLFDQHVQQLMRLFELQQFDVAVLLIGQAKMAEINTRFNPDAKGATDILSFPFHENLRASLSSKSILPWECDLGDIFICPKMICQRFDKSILQEQLPVYVTHGICHLLGYIHDDEKSQIEMHIKERDILEKFNRANGYYCLPLTPPSNK